MIADLYNADQFHLLPNTPGVYRFYDAHFKVIYVGKAKNLKKRVASYFSNQEKDGKTKTLVKSIIKLDFTVVETEYDALLMENNFIKFHQPKYNILLKDDKSFPWIKISHEPFPKIYSTRKRLNDGGEYFGPFTNVKKMHLLLEVIHDVFKLRNCNLKLNINDIEKGKFSECLDYHIKKCEAPCVLKQSQEAYLDKVFKAKSLINGEFSKTKKALELLMKDLAATQNFEHANSIKLLLHRLVDFQQKSSIINRLDFNADIFIWEEESDCFFVHFMIVKEGALVNSFSRKYKVPINTYMEDGLASIFFEIRRNFQSQHKLVLSNKIFNHGLETVDLVVPVKGYKKSILELGLKNLTYLKLQQAKESSKEIKNKDPLSKTKEIQFQLGLEFNPIHIECFDNSNLQGTHPVSACVVFKQGEPAIKEYRHYHIKSVEGPDDFKSMEEVVFRRYSRMLKEQKTLPDLILIDGGKGQLNAAFTVLQSLPLKHKPQLIGLAKKMEEIYFPGEMNPRILDRRSIALKTIQHLRNEAHRFSLKFHRNQRSKTAHNSELDEIVGIGEKTKEKLLTQFKSVQNIKETSMLDLKNAIGEAKALLIKAYFKSKF